MSEEKRKCPGCAEEIPANATVCEYCGEKFNSFLETEQTMEKPELYNPKAAAKLGTVIAKKALDKGISTVVFDRGGFIYAGKVKALAEAAREAGLDF